MSEINWVLTLLVFIVRVLNVTLGTIRIIFISKGKRLLAPLLGFIEVFIWIVILNQVVQNISNLVGYLAYAGGFAVGNYLGMVIEDRLAIGTLVVRIIEDHRMVGLRQALTEQGYGITSFDAQGANGPVKVIYSVINRGELSEVIHLIEEYHPHAFYTVEETRQASEGVFHRPQPTFPYRYLGLKGKR